MHQSSILAGPTAAVSATAALFTPLEQTVIALALDERGRGLRSAGRLALYLERVAFWLTGRVGVHPLADPRLEALRTFINTLHRCRRVGTEAAAIVLRGAGFNPVQEYWLRSISNACA